MTIYVTKSDIKNGERCNQCSCPVALAIKRRAKANQVRANGIGNKVFIFINNQWEEKYLPLTVTKFIRSFDAGNKMLPFRFELD